MNLNDIQAKAVSKMDVQEFVRNILSALTEMDMNGKFHRKIMVKALAAIKQLQADNENLATTNTSLREALIKEVVKRHGYPATGDHPDMYGWVTKADGECGAAHVTKGEALDNYLEALKGNSK